MIITLLVLAIFASLLVPPCLAFSPPTNRLGVAIQVRSTLSSSVDVSTLHVRPNTAIHAAVSDSNNDGMTKTKTIIVNGENVLLGSTAGLNNYLDRKGWECLLDANGSQLYDFDLLIEGGTYTSRQPQQQQNALTETYMYEQPPLAKRQRAWEELQSSFKPPTKVPRPELMEEPPPVYFLAPKGWFDDLCEEVRVQFHRQDSENPRVSPVALVGCSRGGKTSALHELAWTLPYVLTLQQDEDKTDGAATAIIYVTFNGHTPLSPWEKSQPLEALCRRIMYAALIGGKPNPRAFSSFAKSTVLKKEDVTGWLGNAKCILLIDDLNLLEATMDEECATFLKDTFLVDSGRALVFSSHVVSSVLNNKLTSYMHSPSEREVTIKKLPLVRNLFQAREALDYALSPRLALYLGLIPALYYGARQDRLPHQRRQDAIQKYVDAGVSREKVETLLMTMLTGEYALVPEVFREFMDIDVENNKPIALWIPFHMTQVLLTLSRFPVLPLAVRRCLGAIHEQFESLITPKKRKSGGDGWEALFIVTLLTRCLTKSFCKLVPLHGFDNGEVCWNEPFSTKVDFGCESVEEFVSGIPLRRSTKSVSIYFPTHPQFQVYDIILACWGGDNLERQLYGYQLKEDGTVPNEEFAVENLFTRSYLIRGKATTKDSSIRRWQSPSDDMLDEFFGVFAKSWSPKCWAMLQSSSCSLET